MNRKIILIIQIVLIIILGFVIYANSLNGKFIWDDEFLIKDNTYIKDWQKIPKLFTPTTFYRPLQMVTYTMDYFLWGLNVKGYHIGNILVHILVGLCIFWLINILFNNRILSFLTSILFLVHPIHTETVAYISGRADSLSVLFIFLCFIFYIKQKTLNRIDIYILILLSYTFAILSKESSLILPVLLLLYHYSFKTKIRLREFSSILTITIIYIVLRITLWKSLLPDKSVTTLFQRLPGFFVAIASYIRLLLFPFGLHMEYGWRLFKFTHPQAILGAAALLLFLFYAFIKRNNRIVFFSMAWFLGALLPVSNLFPINAYMAEHWLYLPSIGFFLILANWLYSIYKTKKNIVLVGIPVTIYIIFYSCLTIKQNEYWKEPITFYKRTLKYVSDSPRIYYNLGNAYSDIGNKLEAINQYQKAIKINPRIALVYYNLGNVYSDIGNKLEAIKQYQKAIELNPNYADAYNNLCNTCIDINKNKEAIQLCKKAIQLNPAMAKAYYNLGNAYANIGKKEEAIEANQKAIEIDQNYVEAYNNLAAMYAEIGKIDEAIELWNKIVQPNPDFAIAHLNLAVFYFYKKQYDLAIKHCDKTVELGYPVDAKLLKRLKPYRK